MSKKILKKTAHIFLLRILIKRKKINSSIKFEDYTTLSDILLIGKIPSILIEDSKDMILRENDTNYAASTTSVYEFEVKTSSVMEKKNIDVTKDVFSIYVSGVDTYNKIASKTRSDVNIVLTINPVTKKIILAHIPRDYYVPLANKNAYDKLTHASLYGIGTSTKTLEDLLKIEIDYYVRLNFTSLVSIVNLLGGIDVNSKYSFETGIYDEKMTKTYSFKKGWNHLDGDMALAFVRERHAFLNGDITRGENQLLVLSALIDKALSPKILTNYLKFLDVLEDAMITNMTKNEITSFVKNELSKKGNYTIESFSLTGKSSSEYTYSYPKSKLYVMIPNEESISKYQEAIKNISKE